MDNRTYLLNLTSAGNAILGAIKAAEETLPGSVRAHCWVAKKTSPAPWASTERWYLAQAAPLDTAVAQTLTDLKLMSEALACVASVMQPLADTTTAPNLKLAKVRRTA